MAATKRKKIKEPILKGVIAQGILKSFIMLTATLVILGFFVQQSINQQLENSSFTQAKFIAEDTAKNLSRRLTFYQQLLSGLSNESDLSALLQNFAASQANIQIRQTQLEKLIPDVRELLLLPFGWDELTIRDDLELSYASLDLLRQVEKTGEVSNAQVHQFDLPQQHIAIVAPIKDASGIIMGTLHAAFPIKILRKHLPSAAGLGMRIELQQMAGSQTWSMTSIGSGTLQNQDNKIAIKGTIWQIVYENVNNTLKPIDQLTLWGALGGILLFTLIIMLMQMRGIRHAMRSDQTHIIHIADKIIHHGYIKPYVAAVQEYQKTFDLLEQMAQDAMENAQHNSDNSSSTSFHDDIHKPSTLATFPKASDQGVHDTGLVVEEIDPAEHSQPIPNSAKNPIIPEPSTQDENGFPKSLFHTYGIRGKVGEDLLAENMYILGQAIGSEAYEREQQVIIVGRDERESSAELAAAVSRGLVDSGRDVIDIGLVPLPVLYFATHFLNSKSGIMITGGHDDIDYNGLQIIMKEEPFIGNDIQKLKSRIDEGGIIEGRGSKHEQSLLTDYVEKITTDVQLMRNMKLVIDCANGVVANTIPLVFEQLGCEIISLSCNPNEHPPNTSLNPSNPDNLKPLINKVIAEKAELGIAFEPNGNGFIVIDSRGKIIWGDRLLMLFARDILSRHPGADIIYDVKSTRHLATYILAEGGRPVMWKTGHALIKSKMQQSNALLGGEMSGHIYIKERWSGVDDGVYAAARLLEILSAEALTPTEVFANLPESISTPEIRIQLPDSANHKLMKIFTSKANFPNAKLITIDGIRAEFKDGWGLMRASHASDELVLRFEADTQAALIRIQKLFRDQLKGIDKSLTLPF